MVGFDTNIREYTPKCWAILYDFDGWTVKGIR